MAEQKVTPLMKQYFSLKEQYPGALMLFQVGDFYELFFEDAIKAASFLGIALTKRGKNNGADIPLCGIPVHALRHYLIKLVKGGFKVALCDQLSEPKPGEIVQRGVTNVFTPGTLTDDHMLDTKSPSYLFSLYPHNDRWGIIVGEILTAQLFATTIERNEYRMLEGELARFLPDEIILPRLAESEEIALFCKKQSFWVSLSPDDSDGNLSRGASPWIEQQFDTRTVERIVQLPALHSTLQMFYCYLYHTHKNALSLFNNLQFYEPDDYVYLDAATLRNLEVVKNNHDGSSKHTLFSVFDHAKTPMGSRALKKWLVRPLLSKRSIMQRQEVVSFFASDVSMLQKLQSLLASLADMERIVGRIALCKASISDYLLLKRSLKEVPAIKALLAHAAHYELACMLHEMLFDYTALVEILECSLEEDAAKGYIIKRAFDLELDRLRDVVENAQQKISALEEEEIAKTGIESLKIRYNKMVGYAIEITHTHKAKVPAHYIRQQTLTNRERFVTDELLALEREVTHAQNQIGSYEMTVLEQIKAAVNQQCALLRKSAYALAYLDALYSFASCAYEYNYCAPTFNDSHDIIITKGRHPVVEQTLKDHFVANDTALTALQSLWIITGPNMGGKSTYLRQVAHICLLAQCGSRVPAEAASLPLLDRIFTRIGAGDNLAEGKSTFLLEMEETAAICNQATENSLVILDEVGRGTSTYDGLAIAQAVIEYIYTTLKARCLFATHYHELTHLEKIHPGIVNFHMSCTKTAHGLAFFHTIARGEAHKSFGIEVAHLASLPPTIVERAREIASSFENSPTSFIPAHISPTQGMHEHITQLQHELRSSHALIQQLRNLTYDDITPRQALEILWKLKSMLDLTKN